MRQPSTGPPHIRMAFWVVMGTTLCPSPVGGIAVCQVLNSPKETPLRASTELRLSSFDGMGPFSDIADMIIDRRGRVYVLERQAGRIVVANAPGNHIQTIDLRPMAGEFVRPARLGTYLNSIWVLDPVQSRIIWLSDQGLLERVDVIRPSWRDSVGTRNGLGGPLADGLFYGTPSVLSPVLAKGLVTRVPYLRIDQSGEVFDTLLWIGASPHQTAVVEAVGNGGTSYVSQLIKDHTLVSVSPAGDYIVIADRPPAEEPQPQAFTVRRVGILGDTVAQVTVPYVPVPTTQEYLDGLIASRRVEGGLFGGRVDEESYRRVMWRPKYLPPFEQLLAGTDGSTWMAMTVSDPLGHTEREWLVLSPGMKERYRVKLPRQLVIVQASLDEVWGILRDGRGAPHVCRYGLSAVEVRKGK